MKKYLLFILILSLIFGVSCKPKLEEQILDVKESDEISIIVSGEDKEIIDRSENISDYVVELFGIDDAATIIFNDTALVSVIMAYDTELSDETKDLIRDLVYENDSRIKEVLISNDEKTFFQVVEVIGKLMNGSPYDNHVSEITKMIDKVNRKN